MVFSCKFTFIKQNFEIKSFLKLIYINNITYINTSNVGIA